MLELDPFARPAGRRDPSPGSTNEPVGRSGKTWTETIVKLWGLVEPNRVGKAVDPPTAISKTSTLWRPVVSGGFVCREPNVQHYCCISRMAVLWDMQNKRCTKTRSGEP